MPSSYTSNESVDDATDRWERGEAIVNYHIIMSLLDSVLLGVEECTTVKDSWDKLTRTFDGRERWPRIYLQRELSSKQCGKNEDVRAHFAKPDDLRARPAGWGKSIPDDEYAYILLASLPDVYDTIICVISNAARFVKDPEPNVIPLSLMNTTNVTREIEEDKPPNKGDPLPPEKGI